ncbi:rRNA adenine N-6-methyltransferase family protein [Microlunatus sp. GCM10028923]|uniref:rRNA adenine N-6-methyltransferase family protein n=1 Tax=Microlunatus sp. GCM10028923 TaxID=3273400 RepID=UPI00360D65D8
MPVLPSFDPLVPDPDLLDQHLLDPFVARALVAQADVGHDDLVLDLGAGTGSLTDAILSRRPRRVIAVEPDRRCHRWLANRSAVDLRPARVQDLDPQALAEVTMIIANPPFSVLQHVVALARGLPRLRCAYLCTGRHWATAATATPDDDHFSIISLEVTTFFEPTVLTAIPGTAFTPPIPGPAAWLRLVPRADQDPMIMLLVDAIRHRGGLRLKDFLRSPQPPLAARLRPLRSDPVLRRLQQRRLAAMTRADLAQLARRLQR